MSVPLTADHPAQLCWGFLIEVRDQAVRTNQVVFKFLADVARPDVLEVRELFSEIASDAAYGEDLVGEVAADGKITTKEAASLKGLFREIGTEAREGRIV